MADDRRVRQGSCAGGKQADDAAAKLVVRFRRSLQRRLPLAAAFLPLVLLAADDVIHVGSGSYTVQAPAGAIVPMPPAFNAVDAPVPSHQFWTAKNWFPLNLVTGSGPYRMCPQPLCMESGPGGLTLGYHGTLDVQPGYFVQPYQADLTLGVAGLNPRSIPITNYTDWTVDFDFGPIKTRVGRGMPFVYATTDGSNPTVTFADRPVVFSQTGNTLGVNIGGNSYGLFCPAGGRWSGVGGSVLTCELPSATAAYFSLALLPAESALGMYAGFAFSFPVDTRAAWAYNESTSTVVTTYTVSTRALEGSQTGFIQSLYAHQYTALRNMRINTPYSYSSSRGAMKVLNGNSFETVDTYRGILPFLPPSGGFVRSTLQSLVAEAANDSNSFTGVDTYAVGKQLNRVAQLLPVAQAVDAAAPFERLKGSLQRKFQDWFTADSNPGLFYYDRAWGTLIGYPASFGSETQLNDHHFHYGYWVHAAALLGLYDPEWIRGSAWGGMVDLLARDIANPVRRDRMFPFLRHFDVYAGHSWASGQAPFGDGQNQESSSEAINAWAGVVLFASELGDTELRDAAIWMYTLESSAAFHYWFNDGPVSTFPPGYPRVMVTNVFDGKSDSATWFGAQPEFAHGIQFLPFTGGSLYLGKDPAYCRRNIAEVDRGSNPSSMQWSDLIAMYEAFCEPGSAMRRWMSKTDTFDGESRAHEYYWLSTLQQLGTVVASVTANTPFYAVFRTPARRVTHVAFNIRDIPVTVDFSDGARLVVPAGSLVSEYGVVTLPGARGPQSGSRQIRR